MIGEGSSFMKFNKVITYIVLIMNPLYCSANSESAYVTVNVSITAPPCSITVPDTVNLGAMLNGTSNYNPFSIAVNCTTSTTSALYAEIVGGTLSSGYIDRLDMVSQTTSQGIPVQLWLSDSSGKDIIIDGSGLTSDSSRFCEGTDSRECTLTPFTNVSANTPRGEATAVIRFTIMYF